MKVILIKDVKGTGKKDQVIEVTDGFARNFLLPKKLAIEANAANMNAIKMQNESTARHKELERAAALDLADRLKDQSVTIEASCGENGKLFGSVTNKEVAEALNAQLKAAVDKKKVVLKESIHALGDYSAELKLYTDVSVNIKIIVKAK